ncbi:MAG: Hpt domain-containing protein, partial [Gammaproteobacteria bacterium]
QFETDSMAHLETLAGADRNSAGEVLHSMKGASATVGAEGVRAETERVMNVLRSGEALDFGRQAAVMRDLLRDSCSALKDFVTAA